MLPDVLVVFGKQALPNQHLQLGVLQCLDNELGVSRVEEEAVGLSRPDLKLHHLLMISSRGKRIQECQCIEA